MAERERFWVSKGLRESAWSWRVAIMMPVTYVFLGITSLAQAVQSTGWARAFCLVGVMCALFLIPVTIDAVVWKYRHQAPE